MNKYLPKIITNVISSPNNSFIIILTSKMNLI